MTTQFLKHFWANSVDTVYFLKNENEVKINIEIIIKLALLLQLLVI